MSRGDSFAQTGARLIGFLQGKLLWKSKDSLQCIVIAGGVGYEVSLHRRLFDSLADDSAVTLWIHTHGYKDAPPALFGFGSEVERHIFRALLGVSGLGPKSAMALLSEHGAERLLRLIVEKNSDEISKAPGIGKKTSQRIVLELGAKLEKLAWVGEQLGRPGEAPLSEAAPLPDRKMREDLSSALSHLGYPPGQIKATLDKLDRDEEWERLGFEASLKILLAELSGRSAPRRQELDV